MLAQPQKIEHFGWSYAEAKNRYVDELHLSDPDHNPTSSKLLLERSVAKESELCSAGVEQSSIEETHAKQFEFRRIWCTIIQKKLFLLKKGSGMSCFLANISEDILLKPNSQNWS